MVAWTAFTTRAAADGTPARNVACLSNTAGSGWFTSSGRLRAAGASRKTCGYFAPSSIHCPPLAWKFHQPFQLITLAFSGSGSFSNDPDQRAWIGPPIVCQG